MVVRCDWNDDKNRANRRAHGFDFEIASEALDDPLIITKEDFVDDNGEMRYQAICSLEGRLIVISHVYRHMAGLETAWIISIRKAVKYEEAEYFNR